MHGVKITRYSARRRHVGLPLMGCLTITLMTIIVLFGILYATGSLTHLILGVMGVQRVGTTDSVFQATPLPVVEPLNGVISQSATSLELGRYGNQNINAQQMRIVTGENSTGTPMATVNLTEAGLLEMCQQNSVECRTGTDTLRNIRFDLRPGGVVVYLDVQPGVFWQTAGIVMQLDETARQMRVVGVEVDGTIYDPSTLPFGIGDTLGPLLEDIQREGNTALREATLRIGGEPYRLDYVSISATDMTVIMEGP